MTKFIVGPAPHWRNSKSISQVNYAYLLALLPAGFLGCVAHSFGPGAAAMNVSEGPLARIIEVLVKEMGVNAGVLWLGGTLGILAMGMGLGILVEYACQVIMRQPYHATNGHGALMGLIVALLMPPTVPWWILFVGIVVTIVIGKQIFGGIGSYPMHPAVVGWLILLLSWQNHLYPVNMASIAAVHLAPILATLAGGLALIALGYMRFEIPAGVILGVAGSTLIFQADLTGGVLDQLLFGHVALAAFFVATDTTSSPANRLAMWIFGLGIGFLTILIRAYGIWPDAVPFAVLLMNVVYPLLDRIRPRVKEVVIQDD
jgi:electron transport complex protein RnfD